MNKKQVLKEYIEHKKLTVHSKNKLEDIERYTKRFLDSYKSSIDKTTEKDLVNFLISISNFSTQHRNNLKIYLKNFVKWYFPDWSSRFRNLDRVCRTEKPEPTYSSDDLLTKEDVEKLIKGENEPFWKAYFYVLFYGGCRPVEVNQLQWKDITFEKDGGAYLRIYSKKNKREFQKYVPGNVAFYLKKINDNKSEWVFPSHVKEGEHIARKTAYFRLIGLSERVFGKKINPYQLRHSIAKILYFEKKIGDDVASEQMGHSKSMKNVYLHLNGKEHRQQVKKIWIEGEDLPEEKKHELQKQLDALKDYLMQDMTKKEQEKFKQIFNLG